MTASDYWQVFMETGAPEMYLLYAEAIKLEAQDVPENKSPGATGHTVQ